MTTTAPRHIATLPRGLDIRWMGRAACRGADSDRFNGATTPAEAAAVADDFCDHCPVRHECDEYARQTHAFGVWGGRLFEDGQVRS